MITGLKIDKNQKNIASGVRGAMTRLEIGDIKETVQNE
jgi:hypothetical protein